MASEADSPSQSRGDDHLGVTRSASEKPAEINSRNRNVKNLLLFYPSERSYNPVDDTKTQHHLHSCRNDLNPETTYTERVRNIGAFWEHVHCDAL